MKHRKQLILIILALASITLVSVWPLQFNIFSSLPTINSYSNKLADNDPAMFCWNLWWTADWLAGDHPLLDCHLLHHPFGISLAHHTLSTANGIIAFPITYFLGCIPAYNLLIIFHALLTALATFLLAKKFTVPSPLALISACIFTWWPARLIHAGFHLNLASTGWLVLCLYFLVRALRLRQNNWILTGAATLAFVLTGASSWQLMVCLILLLPLVLLISDDIPFYRKISHIAVMVIVGLLILSPLILPLLKPDPNISIRPLSEKETYSIQPLMHLVPSVQSLVFGGFSEPWSNNVPGNIIENTGYLGFGVLFLAILAFFRGNRKDKILLIFSLGLIVLSWGPTLKTSLGNLPLPYRIFDFIPGISQGRTPGRFLIAAGLVLSLLAGRQLAFLFKTSRKTAICLIVFILIELLPSGVDLIKIPFNQFTDQSDIKNPGAILEIPNDWTNRSLMLAQTFHHQPITTGFVARMPGTVFQRIDHIPKLKDLSFTGDEPKAVMLSDRDNSFYQLKNLLEIQSIRFPDGRIVDLKFPEGIVIEPEIYPLDRWSGPEFWGDDVPVYWGTWPEARLRMIGLPEQRPLLMSCQVLAANQFDNKSVTLDVILDGKVIQSVTMHPSQGWMPLSILIPPIYKPVSNRDIWFRFNSGTAPADLPGTDSQDMRKLSIAGRDFKLFY
ncbi:hypothetical protein K8T06_11195 [bacterium]|nr:hypothetical protein [bacterium]